MWIKLESKSKFVTRQPGQNYKTQSENILNFTHRQAVPSKVCDQ